ncbi:MAG: hypothetical protein JRH18_01065 [Deltaproteobacteria bacterium]|nr:hypothetical protein [Deltaproteobacteria bacterium]MBW1995212.1 hypothetical protein [Deltaproteobacteria bacterium]MBW2150238.1 hypothetical protein [Deltaproteobacteria bacterium]
MCHAILFLPAIALPIFWLLPFETAFPLYLSIVGISFIIYFKIFKAMRQQIRTGIEGMLGKKALVIEDIDPDGKIQYATEIWCATTTNNRLNKGEQVKICEIQGLMVLVEAIPADGEMMEIGVNGRNQTEVFD